jgi:hypothetical protein
LILILHFYPLKRLLYDSEKMASRKGPGKFKPGANIDFTQVVPKFLQGRMENTPKPRNADDSDDENSKPTYVDVPEGKERPDREDEAPTIVADPEIMDLLAKQEFELVDGKLERKVQEQMETTLPKDDSDPIFGKKARVKKAAHDVASKSSEDGKDISIEKNMKKRPASSDPEANNPSKRAEKKKLSFDDEENI